MHVAINDAFSQLEDALVFQLEQHARMVACHFDAALTGLASGTLFLRGLRVHGYGITAAEQVTGLAADGLDINLPAGFRTGEVAGSCLEDVGVECAGEAFIAADHNEENALLFADGKERVREVARLLVKNVDTAPERFKDAGDHLGVGTRGERTLLRTAQYSRRAHLHGLGDLARVLHAANAPSEIEYVCHSLPLRGN